jgi:hypothetical protein
MRHLIAVLLSLGLAAATHSALAQEHESRFEMTAAFLQQWKYPVRSLDVVPAGAGPVHAAAIDCEVHIGAALRDPTISDYPDVVLEPPNVCKDRAKSKKAWRAFYEGFTGQQCSALGFVRVWPEHLDNGQGDSNPRHYMELHPLRTLSCAGAATVDLRDKLRAYADLGYKDPDLVDTIFHTFQLWVRRVPPPAGEGSSLEMIAFDYRVCDLSGKCGNRQTVPNFTRLTARLLPDTVRQVAAHPGEEGFKTVLARVRPAGEEEGDATRWWLTKLYALKGTDFYASLGDTAQLQAEFDVIGIFTVDPLSVIKTLYPRQATAGGEGGQPTSAPPDTWLEVKYPIAVVVFGQESAEE